MKIGEKNGKVCIEKADLPITIEADVIEGDVVGYTIKEVAGQSTRILPESLEKLTPGTQCGIHLKGLLDIFDRLEDPEITVQWIAKLIRGLREEDRDFLMEMLREKLK